MRKIYFYLLTLCLVSICSSPASADDEDLDIFESNGIHYSLKGKNKVYIINSYNTYTGSVIDDKNYSWLSGDVVIPKSVKVSDPWHAIYGHQNIVAIEAYAFNNMAPTVRIYLPSTIREIHSKAFLGAIGLQQIFLNEGLETLEADVFHDCVNLSYVNIPSTLKDIPLSSFSNCKSLTSITLPSSINYIGKCAFAFCSSLQYVKGSPTDYICVRRIGERAFEWCEELQDIRFSIFLETIGEKAFWYCKKLQEIKLPANLKEIDEFAFANTGLKTVTNYSLTPQDIQANVFDGVNLKKCFLFVPKGCKEKYQNAKVWKEFGQILEVGDRPAITGVTRIGDLYYDLHEDMTATLVKHDINKNLSGSLSIPATVSFDNYGFTYTYTVNKMEDKAFKDCANLTSVEVPATIDSIPDYAFSYCTGLTKVTLPSSLSKIGYAAFNGCSALIDFTMPYNLREIGISAFYGCESLTSLSIPAGVEVLPQSCFCLCRQLRNLSLSEGLKEIEGYAFYECYALTNITLPESLTEIGVHAFGYTGLTSIKSLNDTADGNRILFRKSYTFPLHPLCACRQ